MSDTVLTAMIGGIVSITMALIALYREVRKTHKLLNSQLSAWKKELIEASGVQAELATQRGRAMGRAEAEADAVAAAKTILDEAATRAKPEEKAKKEKVDARAPRIGS